MKLPTLAGERIRLRPFVSSDIPALSIQANDRTIAKYMPSIAHPYTEDHARRWVNCTIRSARNDSAAHFGIERVVRPKLIGMAGIKNINRADRNGELEYWLGRRFRGDGYAFEALGVLLSYAFHSLDLHRVYAVILATNERSVRLAERLGMVREGVWREACRTRDGWCDVYAYGLLKSEFGRRT